MDANNNNLNLGEKEEKWPKLLQHAVPRRRLNIWVRSKLHSGI